MTEPQALPGPGNRMLFVNVAVDDIARTREFFSALGFDYNEQFCDDQTGCLVLSPMSYVMQLEKARFAEFVDGDIADPRKGPEALLAIGGCSREEVDEICDAAIAAGGQATGPVQDHGFMYGRAFLDLDGHHWEVVWMDPNVGGDMGTEAATGE